MEILDCITKGHRHLVFSLLLAIQVQMHENCMTSQMWINNKEVKEIFFSPSSISNMFGMFLRQQTNCWVARSKTFLLLANEVEQDIEEKYTFFIGLLYLINYLVDFFQCTDNFKMELMQAVKCGFQCMLGFGLGFFCFGFVFICLVFFLGGWESSAMYILIQIKDSPLTLITLPSKIPFMVVLSQSYILAGVMSILFSSSQ